MEIKTLAEVQDGRVSVRVQESEVFTDPRVQIVVSLPSASYDASAAAEVLAGNYARARDRVTELEKAEADYRAALTTLQDQLTEEQAARRRAEVQRDGFDHDRHTERDRADRIKAEAEKITQEANARERRQAQEIAHRFTAVEVEAAKADARAEARASEGARIRSEIRGLLNRPGVEEAMNEEQDQTLARVIRQVRELLDN